MTGIEALLFDAGNTLVGLDYEFLAELIASVQPPPPLEFLQAADLRIRFRLDAGLLARARNGGLPQGAASMGSAELWQRYFGSLFEAAGVLPQRHADLVAAAYRHDKSHPAGLWRSVEKDVPAVLAGLRRRGYTLGVVSNSDGRLRAKFDALHLSPYFAFVLDSAEVGVEKPDRRFFEMGAERCGAPPSRCAYIGDILAVDVLGARAAGMKGVLFDPGDLYADLESERIGSLQRLLDRFP